MRPQGEEQSDESNQEYWRRQAPKKIEISSGEVPEWSNGLDSKSRVRFSRTVGSNPTLSAILENAKVLKVAILSVA